MQNWCQCSVQCCQQSPGFHRSEFLLYFVDMLCVWDDMTPCQDNCDPGSLLSSDCWLIVDDAGGRECDLWYWRVEVGMIRGVDTLDGDMTQAFTTYKYSIAGKHTQFQNILSFCSLEKQLTLYPSVLEVFFKSKKK